ncbi:MAG: biopolymer transporter ExbD [Gemmatimonadaceae bacterium]|jgi:biopolymer transport protein ExbD|nr:biopolymer transporter ExbD [Gemmatimonadaceae bacterium]
MARRRARGKVALNAEINVVSLIDVMMLLMVIFMITAPLLTGGVDITLPKAAVRAAEARPALMVTVTRDGALLLDDVRVSAAELQSSLPALATSARGKAVYLRADAGVPYGDVLGVLATLRTGGIENVNLVAEPLETRR